MGLTVLFVSLCVACVAPQKPIIHLKALNATVVKVTAPDVLPLLFGGQDSYSDTRQSYKK
jgi:hypothetical protein